MVDNEPQQYPFFFYGTLRQGQENYTILRYKTVYEQPARAPSMVLYSLKQYPIMTMGNSFVYGELMFLHPRFYRELLVELDYLEGFDENNPINSLLWRVLIPVELESGKRFFAWAYLCMPDDVQNYPRRELVEVGDWAYYRRLQIYTARYSNQNSKASMIGKPASETWLSGDQKEQEPMPQASIFQWRDGTGWLVLTGRADFEDIHMNDVLAQALARTVSLGPLAYIWAAGDENTAERHLEILTDMGSPTGYLVDIVTEEDEAITEQLEQAGVVIIGDGDNLERLRGALEGTALQSIESTFERGATVIGVGNGALVLAQWLYINSELRPGFAWLRHALVMLGTDETALQKFLREHPDAYGLTIHAGSATAFSPEGALEVWGLQQITVSLGKTLTGG